MNNDAIPVGTCKKSLENSKYHSSPGLSSSEIKYFCSRTPAHYFHKYIASERAAEKTTPAMLLGSLVHCLVLEPEAFDNRYRCELCPEDYPDALRTVPELKTYCNEHGLPADGLKQDLINRIIGHDPSAPVWDNIRRTDDRDVVDRDLFEKAHRMRDSVMTCPEIGRLLQNGKPELSFWGKHEKTGMLTKCRPDFFRRDGIVIDLKTCRSAAPGAFATDCAKYDYGIQQVHYMDVLSSGGRKANDFVFVAIESEPPYLCACYVLNERSVRFSECVYYEALERLNKCLINDHWPGYESRLKPLSLPAWKLGESRV